MKNLLGLEVLHKVPKYRYGKPKSSMREIKNIMREMEYDEEAMNSLVSGMPAHADILVTYDNHPFISELYRDAGVAKVETVSRKYSIAR